MIRLHLGQSACSIGILAGLGEEALTSNDPDA
jgi:hypothetical protein